MEIYAELGKKDLAKIDRGIFSGLSNGVRMFYKQGSRSCLFECDSQESFQDVVDILDSNRINFKIKEYFPSLKTNINLGFLAKHLTWDKESITFEEIINQDKTPDVLALEMKLHIATKKYYKYKAKYLETKESEISLENPINLASDTSSVLPINKMYHNSI